MHVATPRRAARRRARRRRAARRWRSPCAGVRLGSVCVDLAAVRRTVLGAGDEPVDVSGAAVARARRLARGVRGEPARRRRCRTRRAGGRCGSSTGCSTWSGTGARRSWSARAGRARRAPPPAVDLDRLRAGLARLFGADGDPREDRQRLAAAVARAPAGHACSPAARAPARPPPSRGSSRCCRTSPAPRRGSRWPPRPARPRPGCRRPCGDAGVDDPARPPSTLHRLLGWQPGRSRFRHDRVRPAALRRVVVDETSMVSLTMMARLLEAVRPDARLVLVGDPDQLASVEAGAVLGDLARAPGRPEPRLDAALAALGLPGGVVNGVVTLDHVWRFHGTVAAFARAVQAGDADAALALLRGGSDDLQFVETDSAAAPQAVRADVVDAGVGAGRAPARRSDVDGRARRAGAAPRAVRAPARPVRRGPVEPGDRAVAGRRRTGASASTTSGTRAAGAGHGQRLRHRPLQRRHRRRRRHPGRPAGRLPRPCACSPRPGSRRSRPCTR